MSIFLDFKNPDNIGFEVSWFLESTVFFFLNKKTSFQLVVLIITIKSTFKYLKPPSVERDAIWSG